MRLLSPSPGEILDRLSILELKIQNSSKKAISSTHFEAEKASLEERLKTFDDGLATDFVGKDEEKFQDRKSKIAQKRNELAAVNALLWQAEDQVRSTPEEQAFKLASLCKRIAQWNDVRAKSVYTLDRLYGLDDGPEKLHETTMVTDIELGLD